MGKDYLIGTAEDNRKQRKKRFREMSVIVAFGAFIAVAFWYGFIKPLANKRSEPIARECNRLFGHDLTIKTQCLESNDLKFITKYNQERREHVLKNEQGEILRRIRELAAAQTVLVNANKGVEFRPWSPVSKSEIDLAIGRHFVLAGTVVFEGDSAVKWSPYAGDMSATGTARFLAPNLSFVSQDVFRAGKQYCERVREIIGYCEVLIYGELTGPKWAKVHAITPQSKDSEPELTRQIVEHLAFPERFQNP